MNALISTSNYIETLNSLNSKYRELNGYISEEYKLCDSVINPKGEGIIPILSGFEKVYEAANIDISQAQEIDFEKWIMEGAWQFPNYRFKIELTNYQANLIVDQAPQYLSGINKGEPNPRIITPEKVTIYFNHFMPGALEMLAVNNIEILKREPQLIPGDYITSVTVTE